MANSISAKKNIRQNATHRARNRWRLTRVRTAVKDFLATVHQGNIEEAQTKLRGLYKLLDQIAATNTIHKKTASRYKSRLTIRLNAIKTAKAPKAA